MGIRFNPFSNRSVLYTRTKVESPQKQIPFSQIEQTLKPEKPLSDPTQEDLRDLRDSILKVAKDYASQNVDATEEEVRTEVDSKFGNGISDLLNVRLEDQGAGATKIKVTQVNYKEIGLDKRDLLKEASEFTKQNFQSSTSFQEGGRAISTLSLKGPFLDDGAVQFQSGRYGNSFGKAEVEATAVKTDNVDWINAILRR